MRVQRVQVGDNALARDLFQVMAEAFEEPAESLGDAYLDAVLARPDFWVLAALRDDRVVGGLTAHAIPMTRAATFELFIYDIAVHPSVQRQGIGRRLVAELRAQAAAQGLHDTFVLADVEDTHALDFYRALGGVEAPVAMFTFASPEVDEPLASV